MADAKHTPGPWKRGILTDPEGNRHFAIAAVDVPSETRPGQPRCVALISGVSCMNREDEANARIIIASVHATERFARLLNVDAADLAEALAGDEPENVQMLLGKISDLLALHGEEAEGA